VLANLASQGLTRVLGPLVSDVGTQAMANLTSCWGLTGVLLPLAVIVLGSGALLGSIGLGLIWIPLPQDCDVACLEMNVSLTDGMSD
jgi:hypothetical protein